MIDKKRRRRQLIRQLDAVEKLRKSLDALQLSGGYGSDNEKYLEHETYFIQLERDISTKFLEFEQSLTEEERKVIKKC